MGCQMVVSKSFSDVAGHCSQAGAQDPSILGVVQEGLFLTDAFYVLSQFERPVIFTKSELFQLGAEGAQQRAQVARIVLQVSHGLDASLPQHQLRCFSDTVENPHAVWSEKLDFAGLRNHQQTIWLGLVAPDFGKQFVRPDAYGGCQLTLQPNPVFQSASQWQGLQQGRVRSLSLTKRAEINVCFVNGCLLNHSPGL